MNCNLTNEQRRNGMLCRSLECKHCDNFRKLQKKLKEDPGFLFPGEPEANLEDSNERNWNKYDAKPCQVSAIKFTGGNWKWIQDSINARSPDSCLRSPDSNELIVKTLEGVMHVSLGDFVIQGLAGEFYPCKSEIFHKKYSLNI